MANKRKTTTAIVAGVTAVALLLGGTFAWTSISQQAKNESAGIVNVGGRLHDDFNGTNKDVYVENFTDPLNGGQPIYARVKLTEYMEVGQDAGGRGDADGDGKTEAVPVVEGTDIDNLDSWTPHIPSDSCAICDTTETCKIHDHWRWTMGGETEDTDGSTIFMPTFNKDKDSLDADINGTYAGTNPDDKVYYDDYVEYTADEAGGAVNEADKEAFDGKIYSVTGDAYYDDDPNEDENDHENQIGVKVETETHTAKQTATATVITMQEWIDTYDKAPGNYWVYDEDGWAYWANPIMPGEATGLLLDGIEMYKNPGEKCYYAINVVGQFATVNDWEYFTDGGAPSDDAMELLKIAAANVTTVTVVNNGETTLSSVADEEAGTTNTTIFTATAAKAGDSAVTYADAEFTWTVYDTDLNPVDTSTITDNGDGTVTLTVGENEQNANLIIAAKHTASGAVGLSSVAILNPVVTYRLAVSSNDADEYTPYEDIGYLNLDSNYTVTLTANDKPLTIGEVVGVTVVDSYNTYTDELLAFAGSATLQDDGTVSLTVGTQDAELGTGSYVSSRWKIIKLTVKDSEGTEYSRCLHVNTTGMSFSDIIFRNMDGSLASVVGDYYNTHDLAVDTMYTFEPGLYTQSMGTWNEHLDPIWFDDSYTVTAYEYDTENYEAGDVATSVTIKDNTIIFAEAGEYYIEAVTTKDGYETSVYTTVTVSDPLAFIEDIKNATAGMTETVTIDGMPYYVITIDEDNNRALLLSETPTEQRIFDEESTLWAESDIRAYMNGEWLAQYTTLNRYAIPTEIPTGNGTEITTSIDRAFLPSLADAGKGKAMDDYTYKYLPDQLEDGEHFQWVRSSGTDEWSNTGVFTLDNYGDGSVAFAPTYNNAWIRPMLWISLDANADHSGFTIQ